MMLYLDLQSGVSGDMMLSSLLGTGIPMNVLTDELHKLGLDSYELELREKKVSHISTLNILVKQTKEQPLRHLQDIEKIINQSSLPEKTKKKSLQVFRTLAQAEAKVHGSTIDHVHFHEVGAVDTIVDIVGVVSLIEHLKPLKVIASKVNLGSGFIEFSHGKHPVPAPAVAELAKGMLVFSTDIGTETATPTGMALVKSLADSYGDMPEGKVQAVGYGSGSRDTGSYVRAYLLA